MPRGKNPENVTVIGALFQALSDYLAELLTNAYQASAQ